MLQKKTALRQVESNLAQKEANYEASTKAIIARAETAERKVGQVTYLKMFILPGTPLFLSSVNPLISSEFIIPMLLQEK